VLTPGFRLGAQFVIHAVGPIWHGGTTGEPAIRSIAFPAISTGAYGFPKELAAKIALDVMRRHAGDFDRIVACLFSSEDLALYERALTA
jgi:O-acetyl-ADP-ribose deacetylase (regulator of RNase III)